MEEKKLKKFEVKGTFMEKRAEKKFTKTVIAYNENTARENVYSLFGSNHKLKRRQIFIKELKEV